MELNEASEATPAQLADYDQKYAKVNESVDWLVAAFRAEAEESPRHLNIVGLGVFLQQFEHEALAEHLTVAVARLAEEDD